MSNDIQFMLPIELDEGELVSALSSLLGQPVESHEHPDPLARVFLLYRRDPGGFPTYALLMVDQANPRPQPMDVARTVARHYQVPVATDLPDGHPLADDPYWHAVVDPDGTAWALAEDDDAMARTGGLALAERTRRPL